MKAMIEWVIRFFAGDFGDQHECSATLGAEDVILRDPAYIGTHQA